MYKFREPTDRELNTEITRLESLLRLYKIDDSTKIWVENEIERLQGIITKREEQKEEAKEKRRKKEKRAV